jgi:hypothetical protein
MELKMHKTFNVRMIAFMDSDVGKYTVRRVKVPVDQLSDLDGYTSLEAIFKAGQNDFNPLKCPSVSVGDVIEYNDNLFQINRSGFHKITEQTFEKILQTERSERFI